MKEIYKKQVFKYEGSRYERVESREDNWVRWSMRVKASDVGGYRWKSVHEAGVKELEQAYENRVSNT